MAEVSDHPKIRRRDKKRKRAHLEEMAQKEETDEGNAFYSTQYVNEEEFDENQLINESESYSQDFDDSQNNEHDHHHDHDHDHEHDNGNSLMYKVIFLILLVMLGGISTLVLLENGGTEDGIVTEPMISKNDNVQNFAQPDQNKNLEDAAEESFAGRIVSFLDGFIENSDAGEHDHDDQNAHDDHDDHDDDHDDHDDDHDDHSEEDGGKSHGGDGDDHDHSDEDDEHRHGHGLEHGEDPDNDEEIRSEIKEKLASTQHNDKVLSESENQENGDGNVETDNPTETEIEIEIEIPDSDGDDNINDNDYVVVNKEYYSEPRGVEDEIIDENENVNEKPAAEDEIFNTQRENDEIFESLL